MSSSIYKALKPEIKSTPMKKRIYHLQPQTWYVEMIPQPTTLQGYYVVNVLSSKQRMNYFGHKIELFREQYEGIENGSLLSVPLSTAAIFVKAFTARYAGAFGVMIDMIPVDYINEVESELTEYIPQTIPN